MLAPLEKELNVYFYEKAPRLPEGISEFLVMIAPYFTVLGVILGAIAILGLLGVSVIAIPAWALAAPGAAPSVMLYIVASVIGWLLSLASIPGLFARSKTGWNFMFYGVLWSAIINLLSFNIAGIIIGLLIGFYFLFQLRPFYMKHLMAPKMPV